MYLMLFTINLNKCTHQESLFSPQTSTGVEVAVTGVAPCWALKEFRFKVFPHWLPFLTWKLHPSFLLHEQTINHINNSATVSMLPK